MSLQYLILSIGSLIGLAGLFSVLSADKNKVRYISVLLVTAIVVLPITGLMSQIPLECERGVQAFLMVGAQTSGQALHTGTIPLTATWPVFHILQWITVALAGLGLFIVLIAPRFNAGPVARLIGAVWLIFALMGLSGLIGPHFDKAALQRLATYTGLARVPNSIEVLQSTINCRSGALLSGRLFLFSGGVGMFALIGGLAGFKKVRVGMFRPILWISLVYIILLIIVFQFLQFPNFTRIFSVLSLILGVTALIERKNSFAIPLCTASFGLLLFLPFI